MLNECDDSSDKRYYFEQMYHHRLTETLHIDTIRSCQAMIF